MFCRRDRVHLNQIVFWMYAYQVLTYTCMLQVLIIEHELKLHFFDLGGWLLTGRVTNIWGTFIPRIYK